MDLVIEKLSNLESIWRITSEEIVNVINQDAEEFDIFKFKPQETNRITDLIDELISMSIESRNNYLNQLKEVSTKIDEEVRELGVPLVRPTINPHCNLPKQLKSAHLLLADLEEMKLFMTKEMEKLIKYCQEMYKEEVEYNDSTSNTDISPLPNWIHELLSSDNACINDSSFSSVNSALISHLYTAIDQLDPFVPSLSGSLAKFEEAHAILTVRLKLFETEFVALWQEIKELFDKLHPFDENEVNSEMTQILQVLLDNHDCEPSTIPFTRRSSLKRIASTWKRIEKDRSESISGSILLIKRLWNLLETPEEERFQLSLTDLSVKNISLLSEERHRLINFQQQKFKELYDSQVQELKRLMTALKWAPIRQDTLLASCQAYTADGLQFLSIQLATLQPKLELSLEIIDSITSRYNLIDKMREFEKSASDPARLFRSSFQLLQEEKFRKTALPNLLNTETQLKALLSQYTTKFGEEFIFYSSDCIDNEPYSGILENEISNRFMSSGIFGFDQNKQRKERQSSIPGANSTPRYTASNSNSNPSSNNSSNTSRKQSGTSSPPNLINFIPQRRKLDK